jgi:hypothetical protein
MGSGPLVVTYPLTGRSRAIVEEELGGSAEAIYLADLAPAARAPALGRAAELYRARRADALIDIGGRLRMTGLIFNFWRLRILADDCGRRSPVVTSTIDEREKLPLHNLIQLGMGTPFAVRQCYSTVAG